MGAFVGAARIHPDLQRQRAGGRRCQGHLGRLAEADALEAGHLHGIAPGLLAGIDQLQLVVVFDAAVVRLPGQGAAVPQHVHLEGHPGRQGPGRGPGQEEEHRGIDDGARTQGAADDLAAAEVLLDGVFRGIADQAPGVFHLVHHLVAGIDTGGAADAFVLQAVPDVDAGGTHLDADAAIDAIAQALFLGIGAFFAGAPGIAPLGVVGDDQGVRIEHDKLEAGVGADVLAHLLPQEAGVAVGGKAIEGDPESLVESRPQLPQVRHQFPDGHEIADEGNAGPEGKGQPGAMLGRLDAHLTGIPGRCVQLHALGPVTLDHLFDPQENFRIDGLGTAVAAPQAAGQGGEEEQGEGGEDQQDGQVDGVLGPQHQVENVETAGVKVELHRRTTVPGQPAEAEIDRLG